MNEKDKYLAQSLVQIIFSLFDNSQSANAN